MIDEVGEEYYQATLRQLNVLADTHRTTAANIAVAFALQTPGVSSVIVGPRNAKHINELDQLDILTLGKSEYASLKALLDRSHEMITDDVYSYERNRDGRHGSIMKYDLNVMRKDK